GYVLDGIPRSLAQAQRADALAQPTGSFADAVIYLDVPDDVVRERLTHRNTDSSRVDDDPTVVERRLDVFHDAMQPILDYYGHRDILDVVDGTGPADNVSGAVLEALSNRGLRG
ncbi:MAG TPA: nucleoside monophosphate kinase, partial [Acidimicrobiia bacterium]|nr:nucleoside monophosphate kinase [Acidimicrobiia bacterium]